ncbi:MAG: hypothetical protein WCW35_11230 [Bacteroidota bacterium]
MKDPEADRRFNPMVLRLVDGAERFDNTIFNSVNYFRAPYRETVYTCPRCKEKKEIPVRHLENRTVLRFSNFPIDLQTQFDRFRRAKKIFESGYIDWNCRICEMPVRVYVQHWSGSPDSDFGFEIKAVVEAL